MAKKSSSSSRDFWSWTKILAFIALVLSIAIFITVTILQAVDASAGWPGIGVLTLIKDLAFIGAIAFPAHAFVKPLHKAWRIIYWVCMAIVIIGAVLGNLNIIG